MRALHEDDPQRSQIAAARRDRPRPASLVVHISIEPGAPSESGSPTFKDARNGVNGLWIIQRTLMTCEASLAVRVHDYDPLRLPKNRDVGIVGRDNVLVRLSPLPKRWDQCRGDKGIVKMVLRLIHNERIAAVPEQDWQYYGATLSDRQSTRWLVLGSIE